MRRSRIAHQQANRATADDNQILAQRAEHMRDQLDLGEVRVLRIHLKYASSRSRAAFRSRAWPERTASNSVSSA